MAGKHKPVAGLSPAKAPPDATFVHIVQGGNSRRTTVGAIRAWIASKL